MQKILLILLFCCLSISWSKAQTINGLLLSREDSTAIEGAHLINTTQNTMSTSSAKGIFEIRASKGDTIVISNVNFNTKQLIANDATEVKVWLSPAEIQLEEVEVTNLPASESEFRKRLVEMPMQSNGNFIPFGVTPGKPMGVIPKNYDSKANNSLGYAISKPISFLQKKLSKHHKAKVKYYETIAAEGKNISNDRKYNRELVSELTGLKEDELTKFMNFIYIDESFISRSTEYDIALRILSEFENYKNQLKSMDTSNKG